MRRVLRGVAIVFDATPIDNLDMRNALRHETQVETQRQKIEQEHHVCGVLSAELRVGTFL